MASPGDRHRSGNVVGVPPDEGKLVRALIRRGNDTIDIAELRGTTEAAIWNSLARSERDNPGALSRPRKL